jgi:eukaryotic-like serine/threonine-protein kinase
MISPFLTEGTLFADRYRIERLVAHGGMGAVYEAVHLETERRCALKVMLAEVLESEVMRDRFRQEARVTARIQSEFVVDVLDAGIDEATAMPFLVMELLEGEDLSTRLRRLGRFQPTEALTYLHQAALALDKAHHRSIVHRDLKPENLFLTRRDDGTPRIKLLDFGIAKLLEGESSHRGTLGMGTPLYMAPEQLQIGYKLSPAADVYALGMMAFHFIVGTPYWFNDKATCVNGFALVAAVMRGPAEPASARARGRGVTLPPAMDAWFSRATAHNPAERFPSASAAVLTLADALGASRPSERSSDGRADLPSAPAREWLSLAPGSVVPDHSLFYQRIRRAVLVLGIAVGSSILSVAGWALSRSPPPERSTALGFGSTPMAAMGAPVVLASSQTPEACEPIVAPPPPPSSAPVVRVSALKGPAAPRAAPAIAPRPSVEPVKPPIYTRQ